MPVSGFSDLECYVTNKVINGHCDCMFAHNTYQWEWTTILALFAPKPMLFANSDNDTIFPMDGNRRIAERLRQCYKLLGAPDNFDDYVSKGGHDYRPDLRTGDLRVLQQHLKERPTSRCDRCRTSPKIEGKDLRVFPTDDDLPKDAINAKVDETFVPVAKVELPDAGEVQGVEGGAGETAAREVLPGAAGEGAGRRSRSRNGQDDRPEPNRGNRLPHGLR